MSKRILLIQAHPDATQPHLCHALASSYASGAEKAGHLVRHVNLAELDFPLLRSQQDREKGAVPASLKPSQDDIGWAEHIVFFFPLWLGDMPALLKGFLEQVARPGFAFTREEGGNPLGKKGLTGRSTSLSVLGQRQSEHTVYYCRVLPRIQYFHFRPALHYYFLPLGYWPCAEGPITTSERPTGGAIMKLSIPQQAMQCQ